MYTRLQAIDVVGDPQQRLQALRRERAARGSGRQLALDSKDQALNQGALAIEDGRKLLTPLRPHPVNLPGGATALGRHGTLGLQHLADV